MNRTLLVDALTVAGLHSPTDARRRLLAGLFALFGSLRSYEPPRRLRRILDGRREQ